MNLIIGKDIRIENPNLDILRYCDDKLTLDNPDYIIANKLGRYVGKMDKAIKLYVKDGNSVVLPYGCLQDIWCLCKGATFETHFNAIRRNFIKGGIKLYDYQQRALNVLKSGKNGVLEAPCGSGKTQIGLALIKAIGGKALWLTHTKKLLTQSKQRAEQYFSGDFGTITEGQVNIGRDITFATIQTMRNLDPAIYENAFDIVVVDECHHAVGSPTKVMQFYKVLTNLNCRYKYGLSATLNRSDNLISCVYSLLGNKLYTISKRDVGSKIIKAQHIKIDVDMQYSILDYSDSDGTLNYNKLINTLSFNDERNKIIIDNVKRLHEQHKKQLILCHRVKQIEELSKLASTFCKVSCISAKVKQSNRDYDADVIVATYSLAKEGLDIPTLDVVHFATPSKDKSTIEQSAGRVERNYEGKMTPYVMDYVDNNIPYCTMCYRKRVRILKNNK